MILGFDRGHEPVASAAGFVVPGDLRVTEVGGVSVQYRIAGVLGPGLSVIEAVGQGLRLQAAVGRGVLVGAGEDRDQRWVLFRTETGRVVLVHNDAAGEDVLLCIGGDRQRLLLPVNKVLRCGVAPGHVPPGVTGGVVLVVHVVDALVEDEPVGVVHPVLCRRVVNGRPVGFVPGAPRGRRRQGTCQCRGQRQSRERQCRNGMRPADGRVLHSFDSPFVARVVGRQRCQCEGH